MSGHELYFETEQSKPIGGADAVLTDGEKATQQLIGEFLDSKSSNSPSVESDTARPPIFPVKDLPFFRLDSDDTDPKTTSQNPGGKLLKRDEVKKPAEMYYQYPAINNIYPIPTSRADESIQRK